MSTAALIAMNTNQQLAESVLRELKWDPELPPTLADEIVIAVKDGVVTLSRSRTELLA